jgi:GTP-binding protein Era
MTKEKSKFSLIALVGEPNVGKSTLVNAMVGEKISIVTHKVQTTRNNIRGILKYKNAQLVLIDSPGIFEPSRKLEKAIVSNAMAALEEADSVCVLFDARNFKLEAFLSIKERVKKLGKPCYAIINKVDLIEKSLVLPIIQELNDLGIFKEIFPISALKNLGTNKLIEFLYEQAKEGEWFFDPEQLTDISQSTLAEEITREKAFLLLHQEIPYSLKVETDKWEEGKDGSLTIHQSIFVMKESQKVIALGKGGEKIKQIGSQARYELSKLFNCKVNLFLFIKVREDWIEKDYS